MRVRLREVAFGISSRFLRLRASGYDPAPLHVRQSKPLAWLQPPEKTASFILIVDDPDAPKVTWVHWLLYNIPPDVCALSEGVSREDLPAGTLEGRND